MITRQHSLREERLRRITERPNEEEEFSDEAQLDESEGEEDEEVAVEKKGDSDFSSGVTVEAWTSFNRLHTVNNLACLAWAQQLGLPSFLGPGHTVVDFGCGTGEAVAHMAGRRLFGDAQIVGLDTNLGFIRHASSMWGSRRNNASYFWSHYQDDLAFLNGKVAVTTVFTVLHLLPSVLQESSLQFLKRLLIPSGHLLILHYLGRSEECFGRYRQIFQKLRASNRWRSLLARAHHKTLGFLSREKEESLSNLLSTLQKARFRLLHYQHYTASVVLNEANWRIIFNDPSIREMEFGDAYDNIPTQDRNEFISDFANLFAELRTGTNCHFAMVLAKKC